MQLEKYLDNSIGELQHLCRMIGFKSYFDNKRLEGVAHLLVENLNLAILVSLRNVISDKKYNDDVCISEAINLLFEANKIDKTQKVQILEQFKTIQKIYFGKELDKLISKGFIHNTTLRNSEIHIDNKSVNEIVNMLSTFVEDELWKFLDKSFEFQANIKNYTTGYWDKDWEYLLQSDLIHEI